MLATLADWIQGPYIHAVYSAYNIELHLVKVLLLCGFVTPMLCGAYLGRLVDRYGRRRFVFAYGILYASGCTCMHSDVFGLLLIGRVLSGLSTSLLSSVFDAWMCTEHGRLGFTPRQLASTYSLGSTLNAVMAVLGGLVSQLAAASSHLSTFGYYSNFGGPLAPFEVAILVLLLMILTVSVSWAENYSESMTGSSFDMLGILARIGADRKLNVLCLITSFFEASMFVFVMMWAPHLEAVSGGNHLQYGNIFASFMAACMIGSRVFTFFTRFSATFPVVLATCLALLSHMSLMCDSLTVVQVYGAFVLFELAVGIYYPAVGTLKSRLIADSERSTISAAFGIPMNLIVVVIIGLDLSRFESYACTTLMLSVCLIAACSLARYTRTERVD